MVALAKQAGGGKQRKAVVTKTSYGAGPNRSLARTNYLKPANDNLPVPANDNYLLPPDEVTEKPKNNTRKKVAGAVRTIRATNSKMKALNAVGITNPFVALQLKRVRAASASWMIVAFLASFWLLQLTIWVVSIVGLSFETIPLINVLPGATVFQFASLIGAIIGALFMITAAIMYSMRMVDWWSGRKGLLYVFCFALSMCPILFIIPAVFIWCFFVPVLQTVDDNEES